MDGLQRFGHSRAEGGDGWTVEPVESGSFVACERGGPLVIRGDHVLYAHLRSFVSDVVSAVVVELDAQVDEVKPAADVWVAAVSTADGPAPGSGLCV